MKSNFAPVDTTSARKNQSAARCLTIDNVEFGRAHSMSPQSGRQSLAQGKRSERKSSEAPPWVSAEKNLSARFSGRKNSRREGLLPPAKAGLKIGSDRPPSVPLASLATRWALFCRLLRRLVERLNPSLSFDVTSLLSAIVLMIPFATGAQVCAQGTPPASQSTSQTGDRYRIGPGEVLDIRIFKHTELSRESVRVDGSGMIRMPLIDGDIQAACKTESELAKDIATRYLKYYRDPQVDVFVKEYHSREVAVIGAVTEQGRYQMQRRIRLLELISFAKGTTDKAGQTINIVRPPRSELCKGGGDSQANDSEGFISLRLNDTLRGEEKANPYVEPGDIVTVPEADQVYVVGNVYHPQALPMKDPISVSRAIAMAGGPLRDSKTNRVRIVRRQPGASMAGEMFVDLTAIRRKAAEDVALQPNDIVEVSESSGKTMIRSLLGVVAPSLGQLPVRVIP